MQGSSTALRVNASNVEHGPSISYSFFLHALLLKQHVDAEVATRVWAMGCPLHQECPLSGKVRVESSYFILLFWVESCGKFVIYSPEKIAETLSM